MPLIDLSNHDLQIILNLIDNAHAFLAEEEFDTLVEAPREDAMALWDRLDPYFAPSHSLR